MEGVDQFVNDINSRWYFNTENEPSNTKQNVITHTGDDSKKNSAYTAANGLIQNEWEKNQLWIHSQLKRSFKFISSAVCCVWEIRRLIISFVLIWNKTENHMLSIDRPPLKFLFDS